jgi:L-lactate dehydrogenase complex protein LldG
VEEGSAVSAAGDGGARHRILERVRRAAGREGADGAEARAAWAEAARGRPAPRQASSHGAARLALFLQKVEAAAATVSRVSAMGELPKALAHELRNRNLGASIRMGEDEVLGGLGWGTIEVSRGVGRIEEPATISRAEFGMAETGTLVLASGPENPVTLTFLGETHFVVLRERDLVAGFEDLWAAWRERGLDPRTINMVTGPSRSADIGQVLQLGAHGPIALHVFVVAEGG